MQLILTEDDLNKLKPATRADLIAILFPAGLQQIANSSDGLSWDDVVDLTPGQIEYLISGCSDQTIYGLKIIAEHGPKIHASLLDEAGIENYGHFQGRVTKRTRTVTGNKHAFLFTWDDWTSAENGGVGHYAVTDKTFRSLRIYFNMD